MSAEKPTVTEVIEEPKHYLNVLLGYARPAPKSSQDYKMQNFDMAKGIAVRVHELALFHGISEADRNVLLIAQLAQQLNRMNESYLDLINRQPIRFTANALSPDAT